MPCKPNQAAPARSAVAGLSALLTTIIDRPNVWSIAGALALALVGGVFLRERAVASADLIVDVRAHQWAWDFSVTELPVDRPVEFNITSSDVSHGFTIFDDGGNVLVKATVVPGETAKVRHVFTEAGTYPVRCMLYCGMGHDGMKNELTVVAN